MPDTIASLLALQIPNFFGLGAAFHGSRRAAHLGIAILLAIGIGSRSSGSRRPKRSAEPATWAATIVGAIAVWAMMVLVYGVWPHEWLTFANSYLNWGKDTFVVRENQLFGGSFPPIDVPRYVLADIVAAGSYFVFGTINVYLFAVWQKRKVAEPVAAVEGEDSGDPNAAVRSRVCAGAARCLGVRPPRHDERVMIAVQHRPNAVARGERAQRANSPASERQRASA